MHNKLQLNYGGWVVWVHQISTNNRCNHHSTPIRHSSSNNISTHNSDHSERRANACADMTMMGACRKGRLAYGAADVSWWLTSTCSLNSCYHPAEPSLRAGTLSATLSPDRSGPRFACSLRSTFAFPFRHKIHRQPPLFDMCTIFTTSGV